MMFGAGCVIYLFYLIHLCYSDVHKNSSCYSSVTENNSCCSDYREVSGSCEPCLGWFGENCSQPCSFGYFGHGCRKKCNCSSDTHWCDVISGCIVINNGFNEITSIFEGISTHTEDAHNQSWGSKKMHLSFVALGSFIGTSAFWLLLHLLRNWKRISKGRMKVIIGDRGDAGSNAGESQRVQEVNKTTTQVEKIRRSKTLHPRTKMISRDAKNIRSCSLSQDNNGRFKRNSDDYNHLHFLGPHTESSTPEFSSNYNKINVTTSHRFHNTDFGTYLEDGSIVSLNINNKLQYFGEEAATVLPQRLYKHRPYSSVKNHRKVRNLEEASIDLGAYSNTVECQIQFDANILFEDETAPDVDEDFDQMYGFQRNKYVQNMTLFSNTL